MSIANNGGFGQPVGLVINQKGLFLGLEYPAGTNIITMKDQEVIRLTSQRYVGQKISIQGFESQAVVIGISKGKYVKQSFMNYLDDIKSQTVKP